MRHHSPQGGYWGGVAETRGIIRASRLLKNRQSYNINSRYQSNGNQHRYNTRSKSNINSNPNRYSGVKFLNRLFQLYDPNTQAWSPNIKKPPLILYPDDINNWSVFQTQKLIYNQLYLWHPSSDEWVPLYSMEKGFLLLNSQFISYSSVSFDQFTRQRWTDLNSLHKQKIRKLLQYFRMQYSEFASCGIPFTKAPSITIGTPFNNNGRRRNAPRVSLYRVGSQAWSSYEWFNPHVKQFSYEFINHYGGIYHQNSNSDSDSSSTARDFIDAIEKSDIGDTHIYHEGKYYILFCKLDENNVGFNSHSCMNIENIDGIAMNNSCIHDSIAHNYIMQQDFENLSFQMHQIFINMNSYSYTLQFIINYYRSIPYQDWSNMSFSKLFNSQNANSTFLLLDPNGKEGIPIGIQSIQKQSILTNDGVLHK